MTGILMIFFCFSTAAFAYIFYKLNDALDVIDGSDAQLDEIRGNIEMLGPVLGKLLEFAERMGEKFETQGEPPNLLAPLIDAFAASIRGENPTIGIGVSRDSLGRFIDGTKTQSSSDTAQTVEANGETITGS